jgi:hypothetical protein
MTNCNLLEVFQETQILHPNFGLMYIKPYKIGKLVLTSGKLVACDPLVFPGTEPFDINLIPGAYPVILSIAYDHNKENPLVTFAKVCLNEQVPVRWQMATKAGQDLGCLKDGEVFGYGVDSGIGSFMDAEASQIIVDDTWDSENYEETLVCKLEQLLEEENDIGIMWANMRVNEVTGANIIAFSVGVGDGFYSSYFGYGADNRVVEVVTTCISISDK